MDDEEGWWWSRPRMFYTRGETTSVGGGQTTRSLNWAMTSLNDDSSVGISA